MPIVRDRAAEPDETVRLAVDNPSGGARIGVPATAVLTITELEAPPSCSPRPRVNVRIEEIGGGSLQVTVTTSTGSGAPNNRLTGLSLTIPSLVRVDVSGGASDLVGQQAIEIDDGSRPVSLVVQRVGTGPVTIPAVVTDLCGPWRTFFGVGYGG